MSGFRRTFSTALMLACLGGTVPAAAADRSDRGLVALYDFAETDGDVVVDRSGVGRPLDLKVTRPEAVRRSAGSLEVRGSTLIRSDQPAVKVVEAVRRSGEVTIEAWVRSSRADQSGPARLVTLSKDGGARNVTLGQDGDRLDARFRASKTSTNGIPSVATPAGSLRTELTHVVYTRERSGRARVWLDGKVAVEGKAEGAVDNWDAGYHLALANEHSNDRPWLGTYRLVAVFGRALSAEEVEAHFRAGADAGTTEVDPAVAAAVAAAEANAALFHREIAPLLARHCLECHDSVNRKGKLDLSRRDAALASEILVAGHSAQSELWGVVADGEMPKDRELLTAEEKESLRQWIDGGATWPTAVQEIDPLAHKRDRRAAQNWVRRLTLPEFVATVHAAVGVEIATEAREHLPVDVRADGFSNTAYNLGVDLKHVESYARLAEIIVGKMDVGEFAKRFSKERKLTDEAVHPLVEKMGAWLLRGPLQKREVLSYGGIATGVAAVGGDFDEAVGFILQALLQSPRFIYLIENERGDGSRWPVGDYEMASRMSYILWGAPPDAELFKLAAEGRLGDRAEVARQVARMLEDPRAVERSLQFASEWLNLARLGNLSPDPSRFPEWEPGLADDMRDETLAFFKEVAWVRKRPLAELLNAKLTFVTPRLARHYGIPVSDSSGGLTRVDLEGVPGRGGLLTQGSTLTIGGDEGSMVARGLFILRDILRGGVKDPPPGTDTTPVPVRPGVSQRTIGEERVANESCGGCHGKFEPLAFGLERFDGLGAYREIDHHGNALRDDGSIVFPGHSQATPFGSSAEMMDLLAGSERVSATIAWKVTQFAIGRPLVEADTEVVEQVRREAMEKGGTYADLIAAIVLSDLVRTSGTEAAHDEMPSPQTE